MSRESLTRYVWLSIFAAILTISLKSWAYLATNSVGLLSDALESVINLVAAIVALLLLRAALAPPDEEHAFGHGKAEYFASGIEAALVLIAAVTIAWTAGWRFWQPQPLERVDIGLIVSMIATLINFAVGQVLLRAGVEYRSITLEADGKHLLTDVWTSIGVALGIIAVWWTGWLFLDPLIALFVAANITWIGVNLMRRSALGLMDTAISNQEREKISQVLDQFVRDKGIDYHALRTRQAGTRQFVSVHILVPGSWTVQQGHQLLEQIESNIRRSVRGTIIFTHLESLDDPASWSDIELDRYEK